MKLFIPSRRAAAFRERVPRDAAYRVQNGGAESLADEVLLQRYARYRSEEAFAQIVCRHARWVYAVCRRNLRDAHLAEDAAQAVFLLLARKAVTIRPQKHLAGWLFQACRYVLADLRKHRSRYERRQELARDLALQRTYAQSPPDSDACVVLDEAIASLGEADRQAILMRFYEAMTVEQIATQFGIGKDAAKKRVTRALSRLRRLLVGRLNIPAAGKRSAVPLAGLAVLLRAGATEAAPAGLAAAIAKAATVPGLASSLATMVVEGVRQATLHATSRLLVALAATAAPVAVVISVSQPPREARPARAVALATTSVPSQAAEVEHSPAVVTAAGYARTPGGTLPAVAWPAPSIRDSRPVESWHTFRGAPLPSNSSATAVGAGVMRNTTPGLPAIPAPTKRGVAPPRPPRFAISSSPAEWAAAKQSSTDSSQHDPDPPVSEKPRRDSQSPDVDVVALKPPLEEFVAYALPRAPHLPWPADMPSGQTIDHPPIALPDDVLGEVHVQPGGPPHRAEYMSFEDRLPALFPHNEEQEQLVSWRHPILGGPALRGLFTPEEHARFAAAGRANRPDEFDPFGPHSRWTAPDHLNSPFLVSIPDRPGSESLDLRIVPEPSAGASILLIGGGLLARRRRTLSPRLP